MPSRIFPGRSNRPDWNNLECQSRNEVPHHAYLIQYPDQETCEAALDNNRRYLSPSVLLLNGTWDFKLFESMTQLPENIFAYRSGFEQREVPSAYDISTVLHKRPAAATGWPFIIQPPLIPEDIPVGVYHRSVQFPSDWTSLRKRFVLQGVRSAYHVVINGRLAGYAQQGLLTHEFDVTGLVHEGINEVFVIVYPLTSASYLDPIQTLYQSGIVGDLYFEAIAAVSVFDAALKTLQIPSMQNQWQLVVESTVLSYRVAQDYLTLRITLKKDAQTVVHSQMILETFADAAGTSGHLPTQMAEPFDKAVQRVLKGCAVLDLADIAAWTDETPELYDLYLTACDAKGVEYSCVHLPVGFHFWSKSESGHELNGRPVNLMAIRYDLPDLAFPSQITLARHVKELRTIRQLHLNAIVLEGAPVDPLFYEICNYLGLYVMVDHRWPQSAVQMLGSPVDPSQTFDNQEIDPRWLKISHQRLQHQIRRDQNQPCISLRIADTPTSESFDPSGMWKYGKLLDTDFSQEDISAPHTEPFLQIIDRNFLLDGGGPAVLSQTLSAVRNNPRFNGLICGNWDVLSMQVNPKQIAQFDGSAATLCEVLSPLTLTAVAVSEGLIRIASQRQYQTLDNYRLHWQILRNGLTGEASEIDCPPLEPTRSCDLALGFGPVNFNDGARYQLVVSVHQVDATLCHPADALVYRWSVPIVEQAGARDPYLLVLRPMISLASQKLRLELDRHLLVVSGPRFWIVFNRISGMLESWRCGDLEWLSFAQTTQAAHRGSFGSPLIFWRPALIQDQPLNETWQTWGLDRFVQSVHSVQHTCDGTTAEIILIAWYGPIGQLPQIKAETIYKIYDTGRMTVSVRLIETGLIAVSLLPRIGFRLFLRKHYNRMFWSGQGPGPSWPATVNLNYRGQFVSSLKESAQDNLNSIKSDIPRVETEWAAAVDNKGQGLLVENEKYFSFSVQDSVLEDRANPINDFKRVKQNQVELILDFYYKPLGSVTTENTLNSDFYGQISMTPMTGFLPDPSAN